MRAEVISISSQHLDRPTLHKFCTKGRRIRNGANYIKRKAYYEHDKYQIDCNDIDRAVKGHINTDEVKFIIDNYPKEIEVISNLSLFNSKNLSSTSQMLFTVSKGLNAT